MSNSTVSTNTNASLLTGTASSTTKAKTSSAIGIANTFDQFMKLLTTQLQNQSPLDPLDTNQFTQQLVQFAQVEQQLKMNDYMASLIASNKASAGAAALNYIGNQVSAEGDTSQMADGKVSWGYNLPVEPARSIVTIKDSNGNVVFTDDAKLSSGQNTYTWNGRTSSGVPASAGAYKILIEAKDVSGRPIVASTELKGVVESVDMSGENPVLIVNGKSIEINKIKKVEKYT